MNQLKAIALVTVMGLMGDASYGQTFQIEITEIQANEGKVVVAIYDNEGDWFDKPFKEITFQTKDNSKVIAFDVPFGTYAISVYQDAKANGELDRNFLGIPKEPIAFGNNYKPFGDPDFESASVVYNGKYQVQTLKLYTVF